MPETEDDDALLGRFLAGDQAAFADLVRRHTPLVYHACRRVLADGHDAEDAAQAVFALLARRAARVHGRRSLAGWLHRAAWNIARRARDRRRVRRTVALPDDAAAPDEARDDGWRALAPILDDELAALPERYRVPLVLRHLEGRSEDEAARLLGWRRGTVSSRLSRGRDLLRARLARRGVAVSLPALALLLGERAAEAAPPTVVTHAVASASSAIAGAGLGGATLAAIAAAVAAIAVTGAIVARGDAGARAGVAAPSQRTADGAPPTTARWDFEDGRAPSGTVGSVVPGPMRAGNRACLAAAVDGDGFHRAVVRDDAAGLVTYRHGATLGFLYWAGDAVEGVSAYVWDRDRQASMGSLEIRGADLVKGRWTRASIALAALRRGDEPLRDGDVIGDITVQTGAGGGELFVDDVVVDAPGR